MGRKCAVKNCESNFRNSKCSFFQVPKNDERRKIWEDKLKLQLHANSYVCEKHFENKYINDKYFVEGHGKVLLNSTQYTSSENNISPSHIDTKQLNECTPDRSKVMKQKMTRRKLLMPLENDDCQHNDNSDNAFIAQQQKNDVHSIPSKRKIIPEKSDFLEDCPLKKPKPVEDDDEIRQEMYFQLIKKLLDTECNVQLPDQSWHTHKNYERGEIYFEVNNYYAAPENRIFSKSQKVLILSKELKDVTLTVENKRVSMEELPIQLPIIKPRNLEELEGMLCAINSLAVCIGGPSTEMYKNVDASFARKDEPVWRSLKCPIILNSGQICQHCANLHPRLGANLDRQTKKKLLLRSKQNQHYKKWSADVKKQNSLKIIDKSLTPQTKKKVQQIKKKARENRRTNTRRQKIIFALREDIEGSNEKLRELQKNDVDKILKDYKVPANQVIHTI